MMNKEKEYCDCCGRLLNNNKIVWLELSNTDDIYYNTIPVDHVSQGFFPFGAACAKKVLKENKVLV